MSKLIVEMEMPTGCANCPMADDDSRFCKATKKYIPMLCKPSWCPIVGELPDEHGRLIDASTVIGIQQDEEDNDFPVTVDDYLGLQFPVPTIVPATERKDDEQIH